MGSIAQGIGNVLGNATGANQFQGGSFGINNSDFQAGSQEQDLTNALIARSNGTTPSVAQMQLTQGLDQANSQANATAQAQRGVSPALAARLAAEGQSANNQATNQQAGQLRAQEQMTNDAQLQQELQSQRQGKEAFNQLGVSQQTGLNSVNQAGNAVATKQSGSLLSGAGAALAMMNKGGVVPKFSEGGTVPAVDPDKAKDYVKAYQSNSTDQAISTAVNHPIQTLAKAMGFASGGAIPAPVQSPFTAASIGAQDSSYLSQFVNALSAISKPGTSDGGTAPAYSFKPGAKPPKPGGDPGATNSTNFADANAAGGIDGGQGNLLGAQMSSGAPSVAGVDSSNFVGSSGLLGADTGAAAASAGPSLGADLALALAHGALVPGRAQVPGDSPKNDNVPAVLSPGEIVVPRSVAHLSPDEIAKFVAAVRSKSA